MRPGNQQVPAQAWPSKARSESVELAGARFGMPDELEKNSSEELIIPP
jgi:hypothetical protein